MIQFLKCVFWTKTKHRTREYGGAKVQRKNSLKPSWGKTQSQSSLTTTRLVLLAQLITPQKSIMFIIKQIWFNSYSVSYEPKLNAAQGNMVEQKSVEKIPWNQAGGKLRVGAVWRGRDWYFEVWWRYENGSLDLALTFRTFLLWPLMATSKILSVGL